MTIAIVIGIVWLAIGLMVWGSAITYDIFKRQDKIVKWVNESIQSRDLPRGEYPLLKEQNYPYFAFVKGFVATVLLWPYVLNQKLGGW